MKLIVKRCTTCGALGVGPKAVRLHPLNGRLYCENGTPEKPGCWRMALDWDEARPQVVKGIASVKGFHDDVLRPRRERRLARKHDWRGYIEELCGLAGWALEVGDRRTFVHYFSRAVLAWGLKETRDGKGPT